MSQEPSDTAARRRASVFAVVAVLVALYSQWLFRRHFIPGNWVGDQGMFGTEFVWILVGLCLLLSALSMLMVQKRVVPAIVVVLFIIVPFVSRWPIGDWGFRWRSERASYMRAVRSSDSFGDQHSEVVDGRRLVYWRWWSGGIDNGIGVLYDPEDRLDREKREDLYAFKSATGGVVSTLVRIEPGWYYVTHT